MKRFSHLMVYSTIFLICLCFLVVSTPWYEPGTVRITGQAEKIPSSFDIKWDSGYGLNNYELKRVSLGIKPKNNETKHLVKIRFLDKKNSASQSTQVICEKIVIDGRVLPFKNFLEKTKATFRDDTVILNKKFPELVLKTDAFHSISIVLLSNTQSGRVSIEINEDSFERDLYVANVEAKSKRYDFWVVDEANNFTITMDLPRYHVKRYYLLQNGNTDNINILNVIANSQGKQKKLLQKEVSNFRVVELTSASDIQARYLFPSIFFQQILYSLLLTWIFSAVYRCYCGCSGIKGIFTGKKMQFWVFLTGAVACYSFWMIAFWPGVMSVDSLKIWRAAQLSEVYLNDHPILNVFLYTFLHHLWNSPAVVAVFHVLMASTLTAWVFYRLSSYKVSLIFLVPFYLMAILSIPVGLYNTVLWKDIPFALLIVFWAFMMVDLYEGKKTRHIQWDTEKSLALIFLLLALGLIRHNGLIYLVFVPFLFVITGIIRPGKRIWVMTGVAVAVGVMVIIISGLGGVSFFGFIFEQGQYYLKNLYQNGLMTILHRFENNYWGVLDITQTASKWDLFHFYLNDRYSYWFLQHAGWNDVYSYLPKPAGFVAKLQELALAIYWISYESPWVYIFWNPVWALFLYVFCVVGFRWLPRSALFSSVILIQVLTLSVLLNVLNWRYYYFACLASYFIIPVMFLDIYKWGSKKA